MSLCVMKRSVFLDCSFRHYNDDNKYTVESDSKKYKDLDSIVSPSRYRVPLSERKNIWYSKFSLLGGRRKRPSRLFQYDPKYFKWSSVTNWFQNLNDNKLKMEQQFLKERHDTLGTDLAAAHFVVYRGGSVKFCGHSEWIKKGKEEYDDHLPSVYDPHFYVEELDLTGMPIIYEGLDNIFQLSKLKWLSFKDCQYFDDWCLDRISGAYCDSLEYLDISNTKVTDRGISALYRMCRLSTLKVYDISSSPSFKLTCLMLEDINPNINIEGVTHSLQDKRYSDQ